MATTLQAAGHEQAGGEQAHEPGPDEGNLVAARQVEHVDTADHTCQRLGEGTVEKCASLVQRNDAIGGNDDVGCATVVDVCGHACTDRNVGAAAVGDDARDLVSEPRGELGGPCRDVGDVGVADADIGDRNPYRAVGAVRRAVGLDDDRFGFNGNGVTHLHSCGFSHRTTRDSAHTGRARRGPG